MPASGTARAGVFLYVVVFVPLAVLGQLQSIGSGALIAALAALHVVVGASKMPIGWWLGLPLVPLVIAAIEGPWLEDGSWGVLVFAYLYLEALVLLGVIVGVLWRRRRSSRSGVETRRSA